MGGNAGDIIVQEVQLIAQLDTVKDNLSPVNRRKIATIAGKAAGDVAIHEMRFMLDCIASAHLDLRGGGKKK